MTPNTAREPNTKKPVNVSRDNHRKPVPLLKPQGFSKGGEIVDPQREAQILNPVFQHQMQHNASNTAASSSNDVRPSIDIKPQGTMLSSSWGGHTSNVNSLPDSNYANPNKLTPSQITTGNEFMKQGSPIGQNSTTTSYSQNMRPSGGVIKDGMEVSQSQNQGLNFNKPGATPIQSYSSPVAGGVESSTPKLPDQDQASVNNPNLGLTLKPQSDGDSLVPVNDTIPTYNAQQSTGGSIGAKKLLAPMAQEDYLSGYATGGKADKKDKHVPGPTDTVPALLTPGEFVMKKEAVDRLGLDFLQKLNDGTIEGFAKGGFKEFSERVSSNAAPEVKPTGATHPDGDVNVNQARQPFNEQEYYKKTMDDFAKAAKSRLTPLKEGGFGGVAPSPGPEIPGNVIDSRPVMNQKQTDDLLAAKTRANFNPEADLAKAVPNGNIRSVGKGIAGVGAMADIMGNSDAIQQGMTNVMDTYNKGGVLPAIGQVMEPGYNAIKNSYDSIVKSADPGNIGVARELYQQGKGLVGGIANGVIDTGKNLGNIIENGNRIGSKLGSAIYDMSEHQNQQPSAASSSLIPKDESAEHLSRDIAGVEPAQKNALTPDQAWANYQQNPNKESLQLLHDANSARNAEDAKRVAYNNSDEGKKALAEKENARYGSILQYNAENAQKTLSNRLSSPESIAVAQNVINMNNAFKQQSDAKTQQNILNLREQSKMDTENKRYNAALNTPEMRYKNQIAQDQIDAEKGDKSATERIAKRISLTPSEKKIMESKYTDPNGSVFSDQRLVDVRTGETLGGNKKKLLSHYSQIKDAEQTKSPEQIAGLWDTFDKAYPGVR